MLEGCSSVESFPELFRFLPKDISMFQFKGLVGLNIQNIIVLSFGRHIKNLLINIDNKSNSYEILSIICQNLLQLIVFDITCQSLFSLTPICSLKRLKSLKIHITNGSQLNILTKNTSLLNLQIGVSQRILQAFDSIEVMFPRIRRISIDGFKIICNGRIESIDYYDCYVCHKEFLQLCSKVNHKLLTLKTLNLNFSLKDTDLSYGIVLMSTLTQYLDYEKAYKVNIKSNDNQKCVNILVELIMLSHVKQNRVIAYKTGSNLYKVIIEYKNLLMLNMIMK